MPHALLHVYEFGRDEETLFLAMELLLGQSMWEVWAATQEHRRRVPYDLAAYVGARVCEGLEQRSYEAVCAKLALG